MNWKSKLTSVLEWIVPILFGICFFSIPAFSFAASFNKLMWIFTALLCLSIFAYLFINKITIDYTTVCYFCFVVCAIIASLFVLFRDFSFSIILNTIIIVLIYQFSINNKNKSKRLFLFAYFGILLFSIIYLVFYRKEIFSLDFERLGSKFGDINDIGIIMCIGVAISLGMIHTIKNIFLRLLVALSTLFMFALSLTSGSKICILLLFACFVVFIVFTFGRKKWYLSLITIGSFVAAIVILLNLPFMSTMRERFSSMIYTLFGVGSSKTTSYSTTHRIEMFLNGMSLFLRRPLFGFGVNGFMSFSSFPGVWSHNHISESLANFGIVGSIFYHTPIVFAVSRAKKGKESINLYLILSITFVSLISVALFREKFFTYIIGAALSYGGSKKILDISPIDFIRKRSKKNENCRSDT